MRRREREITDQTEIIRILDTCKVLHLGLCDKGEAYIVPMNYGYTLEKGTLTFYLHGAKEGRKYDIMKENDKVSFEMDCDIEPFEGKVACQYGTSYSSIMGRGIAKMIEDPQEKMQALTYLMKTQTGKDFTFNEKLVSIVNVFTITVTEFSAKCRPVPGME